MGLFQKKQTEVDPATEARLAQNVHTVRAILRHYAKGVTLSFGAPTRCPSCGDYGFVESVNKTEGISYNHCFGCQADWVITKEALAAIESAPIRFVPEAPISAAATPARPATVVESFSPATVEPTVPRGERSDVIDLDDRDHGDGLDNVDGALDAPVTPVVETDHDHDRFETHDRFAGDRFGSVEPTAEMFPSAPVSTSASAPMFPAPVVARSARAPRVVASRAAGPAQDRLRVIVVEGNESDLNVIKDLVNAADPLTIELLPAVTLSDGLRLAANVEHQLVLLNLDMPDSVGIETFLEWQSAEVSSAPVIILSDDHDAAVLRHARTLGAAQLIRKKQLVELAAAGTIGTERLTRLLHNTVKRSGSPAR